MSRICVKNLPKYTGEECLRELFSRKGEVTDAKIMRTRDGKSRQFAFIGFRSEDEANEALKYFNNTYIDTFKITCEVARKIGDPSIPRPWSRYSIKKGSDAAVEDIEPVELNGEKDGKSGLKKKNEEHKAVRGQNENVDPELQEFLQVMLPRSKTTHWGNDMLSKNVEEKLPEGNVGKQNEVNRLQSRLKKDEIVADESNSGMARLSRSSKESFEVKEGRTSDNVARNEFVSDLDYLKSRVRSEWSDAEVDGGSSCDEEDTKDGNDFEEKETDHSGDLYFESCEANLPENVDKDNVGQANEPPERDEGEALEEGRLFVRNLPYTANEDDLMELFSKCGNISEVHLVVDRETKRSKGFAYVSYSLPECAKRAMEDLDNSIFQGRLLHILPAKTQPTTKNSQDEGSYGHPSNKFKQHREERRKFSEASGDTRAWNSLFMHPDTVVENVARRYGVSRSELLNPEADDLAVRIALGETHVIAETKKALSDAGVNIAALEDFAAKKDEKLKRSNHVLLIKNLPFSSTESDLVKLFGKFGSLERIILPHTKTLALAIYLEASKASMAFKGMAYKRYKDAPLYLEWAPESILSPSSKKDVQENSFAVGEKDAKVEVLNQTILGMAGEDTDQVGLENRSVFVKNLNFTTSEDSLKKHFVENMKAGTIKSVKIKKHVKNGKTLSMGFGFIEFDSSDTAKSTCTDLQGTVLEGHALILQMSHGRKGGIENMKILKDKGSTKLIVRNVAFEATKKDLRQLFSPFGEIKSLRLPKKFDGNHRGFAFIEYVTKQEALSAFEALSNSHLYGRHLVLEQAKEGETLEELRARTASKFGEDRVAKPSKKRKEPPMNDGSVKFQKTLA